MEMMKDAHDPSSLPAAGHLELRHLRLVQAIALEESVTRAAGRLFLSQSAVSHQLVDLERALGTRLFDRIGKRMVTTAAGARVLAGAQRLLREVAALEREVLELSGEARSELRVTTSCYTSYNWLPAALGHFAASHPRVDITVVLEATRRAAEALAADEVDLAIVTEPPRDDCWASAELVTSDLVVVASPRHPLLARGGSRRGTVKWSDLRGQTVLVHDISDQVLARLQGAVREAWLRESGERLASPVEVRKIPLTEALIELARAGRGVGIVDRWIIEPNLGHEGDLVALPLVPAGRRSFHAVWRKSNPRDLPFAELVSLIRQAGARRLVPRPPARRAAPPPRRSAPPGRTPSTRAATGKRAAASRRR
jgi:LysR family transcriptional regulator for metE and metH